MVFFLSGHTNTAYPAPSIFFPFFLRRDPTLFGFFPYSALLNKDPQKLTIHCSPFSRLGNPPPVPLPGLIPPHSKVGLHGLFSDGTGNRPLLPHFRTLPPLGFDFQNDFVSASSVPPLAFQILPRKDSMMRFASFEEVVPPLSPPSCPIFSV